jgi:E3 ubiquitin-protein ligase MUL1
LPRKLVSLCLLFLKVALLDEEKILPVGKEITAVGICRVENGSFEINPCEDMPCFL